MKTQTTKVWRSFNSYGIYFLTAVVASTYVYSVSLII